MKLIPPNKRWGEMPPHYHPEDAAWISAKLALLAPSLRTQVCAAYGKAYRETWEAEPVEHKQANRARFAANSRLRIFIGKRFATFDK